MASQPNYPKDEDLLEVIRVDRDDPEDQFVQRLMLILRENPSLAKRYEEILRRDAEIGNRVRNGRHIPGLETRILGRLKEEVQSLSGEASEQATETIPRREESISDKCGDSLPDVFAGETIGKMPRRHWLRWVVAFASAGAVGGVGLWVWQNQKRKPQLSAIGFGNAVTKLFEGTLDGFGTGRLLGKENPSRGYRLSRDVCLFRGTTVTWRELSVGDLPVVSFDIVHPGGEKGSLFVARLILPDLPPIPPRQPCLRTSRSSAGWWQENDLACVLVVLGGPRVYQRFLVPPRPLT